MQLSELLPEFTRDLASCLSQIGREDIASQVAHAEYDHHTYDLSCDSTYVHLRAPARRAARGESVLDIDTAETITVEYKYWVNVDLDKLGRLKGVELPCGGDILAKLESITSS